MSGIHSRGKVEDDHACILFSAHQTAISLKYALFQDEKDQQEHLGQDDAKQ